MRLIDADALRKDDEVTEWITKDTIRTGKTLKAFSELFIKKIDNQPTVDAIPIEVLNEIDEQKEVMTDIQGDSYYAIRMGELRGIIDHYRKEQE